MSVKLLKTIFCLLIIYISVIKAESCTDKHAWLCSKYKRHCSKIEILRESWCRLTCTTCIPESKANSQCGPEADSLPKSTKRSLSRINDDFAWNLYKIVRSQNENKNVFFSPISISIALGMVMEATNIPQSQVPISYSWLLHELNRAETNYTLYTANSMWIERSMRVLPGFSNAIVQCFDSQVERRDFVSEPQIVRQEINDWVETKTKDKIQDLVPPAAIDSSTRLVLVNAIYFKGEWMHPFTSETSSTFKDTFYPLVSERKAKVTDFMTQKGTFSYYEDSLMQILSLPYRDNELSMLIMLPKSRKGLLRLEQQISSGQQLIDLASKMTDRYVQVTIPKFKTTLRLDLKKTLKEMGMSHMFDKNADFSGITGDKRLVVSDALHKAFIEVNEKGTEAAAATAVVFSERAAFDLELPVIFKADHAFLFSIRHENTQTPLFFGSLVNV